jgi:acyl-CoA synthetase (NDP forming)
VAFLEEGSSGGRAAAIDELASRTEIPVAVVWLSQSLESPSAQLLERSGRVGIFRSMELCLRTVAHLVETRSDRSTLKPRASALTATRRIADLRDQGASGLLDEVTSTALLQAAGVPIVANHRCRDLAELASVAEDWSIYPAVLKIVSDDLAHKAKAGGVQTSLGSRAAIVSAGERMLADVQRAAPKAKLDGFLLQQMVFGSREILVGGFRDPIYGPVVAVGSGGTEAGISSGVAVGAAPLALSDARRLLAKAPGVNPMAETTAQQLAEIVVIVGDLLAASALIGEIDINPLIVTHDGQCLAVDGLVTISPTAGVTP